MKFFKVLPKENLKSACKRYLKAYNFIKKKHRCFPVNIPEFLEQLFFFIDQLQWLLLNNVLASEIIFIKESCGEI